MKTVFELAVFALAVVAFVAVWAITPSYAADFRNGDFINKFHYFYQNAKHI